MQVAMPSFFKDLRRKSRASFRTNTDDSLDQASSADGRGRDNRIAKSSSTTVNSTSPPTTLSSNRSMSNGNLVGMNGNGYFPPSKTPPPVPARPRMPSAQSNRTSMLGLPTQNGERQITATSPWAPRVLSVSDGSWVHQKVLLIFGTCADPNQPIDGQITVTHHQDNFPSTQWPVSDSHFKALVYLRPGPNRLRLDFTSPKLPTSNSSIPAHSSWININFLPLNSAPPLQLCILVAKDSPETFDAVPERIQREGNNLATAIRKFRMAAYLWQAFTAEQMNRNGFGRRCYRYEEEWQPGTLTVRDMETAQMRNEAKIHVIRLDKTVDEIRDLDLAQQYEGAKRNGDLFSIASQAVRDYFKPGPGQRQYVSCMYLDTHWDKQVGTIRGHAALGGGDDTIKLAIFGSHCLQSYPAHIEEVVPAFTDCTRTDTEHVANDCNESGSSWEAANIGIGAHLHETGHLLGCPHQESGVMLRDYVTLNRTFTTREPYSTRTKQQGQRLVLPKDECAWHRLDTLRFRFHPIFHLPTDPTFAPTVDRSIQVWAVDSGTALITAPTGIAWIELFPEGDGECHHWIEYLDQAGSSGSGSPAGAPRQITITETQLRERLPEDKRKRPLRLVIFSCGGAEHEIRDFAALCSPDATSRLRLPDGRPAFRSSKVGSSAMEGSQPFETMFTATIQKRAKIMTCVRVHKGDFLDGIEFLYEDNTSDLFGKRGGSPHDFALETRRGEMLLGFHVRAGYWIDAVQVLTTTGRRSDTYGNATGGEGYTFIPPRGYSIAGVHGSCGPWMDGFGLIIAR